MDFLNRIVGMIAFLDMTAPPAEIFRDGQSAAASATEAVSTATDAAISSSSGGGGDIFSIIWPILMWGGVALILFFFMYRQPKKEMKRKQELKASIKVGDSIITNAGLFGKVVEIGTDSFIVEFGTNRGVRVPILKDAVEGVREPRLEPPMIESK